MQGFMKQKVHAVVRNSFCNLEQKKLELSKLKIELDAYKKFTHYDEVSLQLLCNFFWFLILNINKGFVLDDNTKNRNVTYLYY